VSELKARRQNMFIVSKAWLGLVFLTVALCPSAMLLEAANLPQNSVSAVAKTSWQMVVNTENPAGPGRWIRTATSLTLSPPKTNLNQASAAMSRSALSHPVVHASMQNVFVVRAGDQVVLDEDHGQVSFSLIGRALSSAQAGQPLRMQLLGSNAPVLHVIVLSAGHVGFAAQTSGWQ